MQDMIYSDSEDGQPAGGAAYWGGLIVKWGGAVLSLGLVLLLIVWAYRLGTRDAGDVPVIKALGGAVRVAPADPGGQETANQGLEVNEVLGGNEASVPDTAELAPPPVLLSEEDVSGPLRVEPEEIAEPEEEETPSETVVVDGVVEVEVPADAAGDLQDLIDQAVNEVAGTGAAETAPRPKARPNGLEIVPPPATSEPELISGVEVASVAEGTRTVQLGAFDSQRDARAAWAQLSRIHFDLLGTRGRYIQEAQSNGRVFYRLRALGFDDATQQNSLCEALKARAVPCIPVTAR